MAELEISFDPDDDALGKIVATVKSGAFSGRGSAWFDRQAVKDDFIDALRKFPLASDRLPVLQGGFWSRNARQTLEQRHLRIAVRPYNPGGQLLVEVDLATQSPDAPDVDLQQAVTARFLTDYAAAETFATDFEQVLDGQRDRAVLRDSKT
jgi:hypothetical protein